eukprot:COSAG06_NODE_6206_length_3050_cov_1.678753_1_plen_213_part_00
MTKARGAPRRLARLAEHVVQQRDASAHEAPTALPPTADAAYHALNPALDTLGSLDADSAKAIAYVKSNPPHARTLQYTPVSTVEAAIREVKEKGFAVWPGFITVERAARLAEALEPHWSDTENQPGVNGPEHKLTGRNLSTLLARTRNDQNTPTSETGGGDTSCATTRRGATPDSRCDSGRSILPRTDISCLTVKISREFHTHMHSRVSVFH